MDSIQRDIYVLKDVLKIPITVTEGTNMIPIEFTVRDYDIPITAAAVAYAFGPGMTEPNKLLCDVMNNVITFTPTKGFFSAGINVLQIRVVDGAKALISFKEHVKCEGKLRFADETEEEQQTLIEQLLVETGTNKGAIEVERARIDNLVANQTTGMTGYNLVELYVRSDACAESEGEYYYSTTINPSSTQYFTRDGVIPGWGSADNVTIVETSRIMYTDSLYESYDALTGIGDESYEEITGVEGAVFEQFKDCSVTTSLVRSDTDDNDTADGWFFILHENVGTEKPGEYAYYKVVIAYSVNVNLAELEDLRVDLDGKTHESAGAAVREQIRQIRENGGVTDEQVENAVNEYFAENPDAGGLPAVTAADDRKFLRVVDGKWAAVTIPVAEEESY